MMLPSEELKYSYIMEKDGRDYEFENYPLDNTFNFKEIKLLNPEAEPKITDYNLWNDDGDFTNESFTGNKLFIILHDVNKIGISKNKVSEFINKVLHYRFHVKWVFIVLGTLLGINVYILSTLL